MCIGVNMFDIRIVFGKIFLIFYLNENNLIEVYKKYVSLRL